jgi:hypothetical protein
LQHFAGGCLLSTNDVPSRSSRVVRLSLPIPKADHFQTSVENLPAKPSKPSFFLQVHSEYLADATRHCLLSTNDAPAKACIDEIFQQLLDFRKHLKRAVRSVDQPAAELEIDEVNEQVRD